MTPRTVNPSMALRDFTALYKSSGMSMVVFMAKQYILFYGTVNREYGYRGNDTNLN